MLSTFLIAAITLIVVLNPITDRRQVSPQTLEKIDQDVAQKYEHLLIEAKAAIQQKDQALDAIRSELQAGYVVVKDFEVTSRNEASWLSEPKLMLGVKALTGGRLHIQFANRNEFIAVGERIDFEFEGCDCFILLKASRHGQANFRYACTPVEGNDVSSSVASFAQAQLQ
ncbi:hypothetical protein [Algirhabdus cladophorae]|uniref:hypothetical protein n=1 Tax=Algirhabdus cladophorae TaxID=3377108 RepID=UPI003B848D77